MESVRVRFAPSPTGHLHIGGARTAIYNWAFARGRGGTFILRIDDTDPERSTEENTLAILRAMRWLGLDWDEGPEAGGDHGPYFQTQRGASYAAALLRLSETGAAYPCFCSTEELDAKRDAARTKGGFAGYDRTCRALDPRRARARVDAGEPCVWRLVVPAERVEVAFDDAIRGPMSFPAASLDDFVLVRTDGTPTYNFATVIDDVEMAITHVVRGDDHLSNTPRQILVFEALGAPVPVFAHLSMILGADGKRLSKRHGAASVEAFRDAGYLPEAVVNYLALLGWSIDGERTVFTRDELVGSFALDRVSRNPAIFDPEKLDWLNGVYIREMTPAQFVDRMAPRLEEAGLVAPGWADDPANRAWLERLSVLVCERVKRLDEVVPAVRFLFEDEDFRIDGAAREKALAGESASAALGAAATAIEALPSDEFTHEAVEAALRALPESLGIKPKELFQAVRVATTGSTVSPPLFESLALLGRDRTSCRLRAAM